MMKKSDIKVLGIEFVIISILIANVLVIKQLDLSNLSRIIIWSLILLSTYFLIGLEKDKSLNKVDTSQIIFIYTLFYIILTYVLGICIGFTKSPYSLNILNILKNLLPVVLIIILQEMFRYTIAKKCQHNKLILTIMIIIFISMDIIFNYKFYNYTTGMDIYEVIGILILPSIINHIVLTFISTKSGYTPPIIYRILLEGLIFVVPIVPDLNSYLNSIFKLLLPTVLFLKFNTIYATNKFNHLERKKLSKLAINSFIITAVFIVVGLVSGAFNYYAMAIGSASMYPKIKKGDAVIIEKYKKNSKLEKGTTIVYHHDKKTIVHRIDTITTKNNKVIIKTKGDNNKQADTWIVAPSDIVGIVKLKIPLIGWPSVWISEAF